MTEEKTLSTKQKIFDGCIFLLILYIAFAIFGVKPYAILKARNPNNLVQGCLYVHTGGVSIDGISASFSDSFIKPFPASKKHHLIFQNPKNNTLQCHKVTYVKVFVGYKTVYFPYDFVDYWHT